MVSEFPSIHDQVHYDILANQCTKMSSMLYEYLYMSMNLHVFQVCVYQIMEVNNCVYKYMFM